MSRASPVTVHRDVTVGRHLQAIQLENDLISTTIVLDQGADVLSLLFKPKGIEAFFQVPWTPREPGVGSIQAVDSFTEWCLYYRGGWNLLFPNLGGPISYKGTSIDRHGEAARAVWWRTELTNTGRRLEITLETELRTLPFHLQRKFMLEAGQPVLTLTETITNTGPEDLECVWFDQLMFGKPLLDADSLIDTGARKVWMDEGMQSAFDVPSVDLPTGETWNWPLAHNRQGDPIDLSSAPEDKRTRLLILDDFYGHWCSLTNPHLELGVGVVWDGGVLPYAYLYEETGGWLNFPYFGRANMVGFAPASSHPIMGMDAVRLKTDTQFTFAPGESRTLPLKLIYYEGRRRVQNISLQDGQVTFA